MNGRNRLTHLLQGLGYDQVFCRKQISLLWREPAHIEIWIFVYGMNFGVRHIGQESLWKFSRDCAIDFFSDGRFIGLHIEFVAGVLG